MQSFLDPAILFFVFGLVAGGLRSNLEIPPQIARFLSLYLLMALGLKGGFALAASGLSQEVMVSLALAIGLAVITPALGYLTLKRLIPGLDAAALAATYGSVSAVTFITAVQHLDNIGMAHGGHMAAAMALMESPAIVMAVWLANRVRAQSRQVSLDAPPGKAVASSTSAGHILRESLTDGAQMLLIGAMVIGLISGPSGQAAMKPFAGDLFKGMLAFFLLDMGLQAAKHVGTLRQLSPWLLAYGLGAPLVHAGLALGLCLLAGVSAGNTALLMVLAASASYIAVPAVIRHAIPEANPSLYIGMSLGLTFPFNILVGISFYTQVARLVVPGG